MTWQLYLAQARHDDLLREAAQRRLAVQARQARPHRRPRTAPLPARRLARAWQRLAAA